MTQFFKRAYFLLFLPLVLACNKVDVPEPEPEKESPVFFSNFDVGGSPMSLTAGQDNYFMDASYRQDSGVIDFIGIMRPLDCVSRLCPGSLRIGLRHTRPVTGTTDNVGISLEPRVVDYAYRFTRDSVLVKFIPVPQITDAVQSFVWSIDGESFRPNMPLETVLIRDRDYQIALQSRARGCSSKQTQTVRIPVGGCRSKIRVKGDGVLSVRSTGVPPLKYNWMNQSKDSVFHIAKLSTLQNRNIRVQVTDANGCISESEIGFDPSNRAAPCIADFEYNVKRIVNRDHFQLGRVTIDYIDESGVIFTSNFLE